MDKDQEKMYLTQLRIEEITRMLRSNDLGIRANPEDRSPSPEPQYDSMGKRTNTREVRCRAKLELERHGLVVNMLKFNPAFKPPADYKAIPTKVVDKVFIPQDDYMDINFVGLLIGPRGQTLKNLEKDTNAKIIIRGRGSIKEGKIGNKNGQPLPGEDEQLHAYITGTSAEIVAKACQKVRDIVDQAIAQPGGENDLRKAQLRELALLNGTLRENDSLNKLKVISMANTIVTNTIICDLCGGAGHITSDCKMKRDGISEADRPKTWHEREKMDSEYMSLMAELGQGEKPDADKIANAKCIIQRSGAPQHHGRTHAIEAGNGENRNNDSPRSSNDYSNSPKYDFSKTEGVSEETVNGRKIIDMTKVVDQTEKYGRGRDGGRQTGGVSGLRANESVRGHARSGTPGLVSAVLCVAVCADADVGRRAAVRCLAERSGGCSCCCSATTATATSTAAAATAGLIACL